MRILHLVHQYPPDYVGGTELYTRQLARSQAQQGHQVAVFCPTPARAGVRTTQEDGVQVVRVGVGARSRTAVFLATWGQPRLSHALAPLLSAADLVHVQHLMGLPASAAAQAQAASRPVVVTLHDYWYPCANAQLVTNYDGTVCAGPDARHRNCGRCLLARGGLGDRPWAAPIVAPLLRRRARLLGDLLRRAERVIAPTQFVAARYREMVGELPRLRVIPHGCDAPLERLAALRAARPPRADLHVVYVGSIAPLKGVHTAVEAFNRLPADGLRLTLAGSLTDYPDYAAGLQATVRHPGIRFVGRLERDALWALLASADLAVMPTLWYEASPLTIDEQFAAGLPVVGSAVGALREKIRDGVDGALFPPGDAAALAAIIGRLAAAPADLDALRAGVRPPQSIADHTAAVLALYTEMIGG